MEPSEELSSNDMVNEIASYSPTDFLLEVLVKY